jgi:hypothetical protein
VDGFIRDVCFSGPFVVHNGVLNKNGEQIGNAGRDSYVWFKLCAAFYSAQSRLRQRSF